jgi:NAD(P)H-dependent FMN reductase
MQYILIISASIRTGRKSDRVAAYFMKYIEENKLAVPELLDLNDYAFPIFKERLKYLAEPPADLLEFAARIKNAGAIIIVTPEYNGGYPASLKNAIDVLYEEWQNKPVALVTVSDGAFGGSQVMTSLQFTLWKMGVWVVPARFQVAMVDKNYNEAGEPAEKAATDKRAAEFLGKLKWCMDANEKMSVK